MFRGDGWGFWGGIVGDGLRLVFGGGGLIEEWV